MVDTWIPLIMGASLLVDQVIDLAFEQLRDSDKVINVGLASAIFPMADSTLRYAKGHCKFQLRKPLSLAESADSGHFFTSIRYTYRIA
jgi:hypothetical protein